MNKYYQIQYSNKLFNTWINYDLVKYKTLQSAQNEVLSYKKHKLGIKLRIIKIEVVK